MTLPSDAAIAEALRLSGYDDSEYAVNDMQRAEQEPLHRAIIAFARYIEETKK